MKKLRKILIYVLGSVLGVFLLFLVLDLLFPLRKNVNYSLIINDRSGEMIHSFLTNDDKWRMYTELSEINPVLKNTIIYKEDRYFYYHPGINPIAICRAVFNNIVQRKKTSGASTITMQVARLLYPDRRTYLNKIREMFRAFQLEWHYSKSEILQLYINLVPFGGNIEGVKAASLIYFGTKPANVNLSQAVILSIIPNRPNSLNPVKGTTIITRERNKWLQRMLNDGIFEQHTIREAFSEPVIMERRSVPREMPHFANRLFNDNKTSQQKIIRTCIDRSLQKKTETIAWNHHKQLELLNIRNLAVIIVDNKTHEVRAYLGSPDFHDAMHAGQVDGVQAIRSPGSTLKPLVYAMAIDKGIITPKSILPDVPVNFAGYTPENFNSKCNGLISAEKALSFSLNIPAVELLNKIGVPAFKEKMKMTGFESLPKNENSLGLSMVLGGCGVKLEELAGMYCMFANGGAYMPLKYIQNEPTPLIKKANKIKVVSDGAAFMTSEMLNQLIRPDLPNNYQSSYHVPKIAWKTGTSYGRRDAWSVGYNQKYTVAVWVGNFSGEGVPELTGADMATPLLFDIFNSIDYNSQSSWFVTPKSIDFRIVCSQSGLPPGEFCNDLVTDYFIPAVSDYRKCSHLREVAVDPDEKISYCRNCMPETGYKKIMYPNLPTAVAAYYTSNGIEYKKVPPHNPECTRSFAGNAPSITSPVNQKEYLLEKNSNQQLQLSCTAESDIRFVYWYINDQFYKKSKPSEVVFFTPNEGKVKISCSDDQGRNTDIQVSITYY